MKISLLLLHVLCLLSLLVGSVHISPAEVWAALMGSSDETVRYIVTESRLPQMCTALLAGAALGVSGLVMQTLFSNPLADPSLLGVNSGASLGAAIALLTFGGSFALGGAALSGVLFTVGAAFVGACAVIALIALCSRWLTSNLSLLVAGVMLSFIISSVISLLSFYAKSEGVRSFVVWGLGDFSGVSSSRLWLMSILVIVPVWGVRLCATSMNALLLGADYATNLGVNVKRVRTLLLILTGLLTAVVTALCGPISFIGLAAPHVSRMLLRTADHRKLLPAVFVMGADVALLSLILSHLPGEAGTLPIAAITPLLVAPVVLYILVKRR